MTVPQMYDAADSILAQKVAQVNGVGQVFVGGSAKPAVRVEANPMLLASYGIGLEALRAAIGQVNVNQPTGYLNGGTQRIAVSGHIRGCPPPQSCCAAEPERPIRRLAEAGGHTGGDP